MSEEKVFGTYEMSDDQAEAVKVGNLRFRPTSSINGEAGKSGAEMQKAFDAYPDELRKIFNTFVKAVMATIEKSGEEIGSEEIGKGSALAGITLTDGKKECTVAELLYTLAFGSLLENFPDFQIKKENADDYIGEKAVETQHIADDAVTGDKVANEAVTTEKLAKNSVTTEKIADGSVAHEKLKNPVGKKSSSGEIFNDYTNNKAGYKAHVEGQKNTGTGDSCHVEGASNIVTAGTGHAEGRQNNVDAPNGHAEGQGNIITKDAWSGHIEGQGGEVHGHTAHGGGFKCKVYARHGFAHGLWLIAGDVDNANDLSIALAQSVFGRYNQPDLDALLMIGNGTGENKRSNALVVKNDGRTVLGALPTEAMDAVPKAYVDALQKVAEEGLQTILDTLNEALGKEVTA